MTLLDPSSPTSRLYERVSRVIPPFEWQAFEADVEAILKLKRERDAIILAVSNRSGQALSTGSLVRNTNLISEPGRTSSSRVSGSDRLGGFNLVSRRERGPVLTIIRDERRHREHKEPCLEDFSLHYRPVRRAECNPSANPGRR